MQTVLITGGTGLIGKAITSHLVEKKYNVIILTRKLPEQNTRVPEITYALWDVKKRVIDIEAVKNADYIIHLAGAGVVDKKWTDAYKKEIVDSRTESSKLLIKTLRDNDNKVKAIISASAIGWYGEDGINTGHVFVETDKADKGFLGETCRLWEQSVDDATALKKRVVKIRTGIVLSRKGGALKEFELPVKFGVAGILASGKQMVSWIHVDDICRMYLHAMENETITGSYNAVAPMPVNNKTLTLELARKIKGKFFIPMHVPSFVLKIMLGDRSIEVLKSATVSCAKIKETGFVFLYPTLAQALQQLYKKTDRE